MHTPRGPMISLSVTCRKIRNSVVAAVEWRVLHPHELVAQSKAPWHGSLAGDPNGDCGDSTILGTKPMIKVIWINTYDIVYIDIYRSKSLQVYWCGSSIYAPPNFPPRFFKRVSVWNQMSCAEVAEVHYRHARCRWGGSDYYGLLNKVEQHRKTWRFPRQD